MIIVFTYNAMLAQTVFGAIPGLLFVEAGRAALHPGKMKGHTGTRTC